MDCGEYLHLNPILKRRQFYQDTSHPVMQIICKSDTTLLTVIFSLLKHEGIYYDNLSVILDKRYHCI